MEILIILSSFAVASLVMLLSKNRKVIEFISVFAVAIALVSSVGVALKVSVFGVYNPFVYFSVNSLSAIMMLVISFVGMAVSFYSVSYLREETAKDVIGFTRVKQYYVLLNLFLGAMFLAVMSNSPILSWISIEATTLSTAFLISIYNKPSSIEAAWKYLIINSVGLLLAFFGTLLYFTAVKTSREGVFMSWHTLVANAGNLDPLIAKIAFIFVLIGYGTKIGLAPMHTWLPDAHSKAPAPISALLSGVLLNVAFVTMLRFKNITDVAVGSHFSQTLLISFGLLSVIISALIIFTQQNYKRLLAYSSIENMGILSLGFGFGGVAIYAAILHMVYHSFIKSALFLSAGTIFLRFSSTKIKKVTGALTALPVTSILFLLGFFIITGTPPFGIFNTKLLIFSAGIISYPWVAVVGLFSVALLFVAFFRHATAMFFGEKPKEIVDKKESVWLIIPPLFLVSTVILLSFYIPPFLITLINSAVSLY